ncbi:general secretion pathway protein GspB [Shewanella sp. 125m-7]
MSILLDAVTKNTQQSQAITHDVVLTPRAQYKAQQATGNGVKYVVIFVLSLLVTVMAAWLLSRILYPVDTGLVEDGQIAQANLTRKQESVEHVTTDTETMKQQPSGQQSAAAEIRLAGKVALPMAQTLAPQVSASRASYGGQSSSAYPAKITTVSDPQSDDLMAALIKAQKSVDQGGQEQIKEASSMQINAEEPIILGANSNKRGDELLESLKYQVENAANDVGLERSEPENKNNLLAAFEAALKDVERNNSVATPVTEEKLDPIPTTAKSDAIPKYGQLPAGLQLQVPEFNISAHVYSSVADNRWLNVDGAELQEGDSIQGKLTIVEIRPRDVVLAIQGTEFKVPAI